MQLRSSLNSYGPVAVTMHWLSALLILALIGSGLRASGMEDPTGVLRFHVPVGITILLLTLARIGWWFFADTKPASSPMSVWQDRLSRAVHFLFYAVILGMTASGIGMLVLSDAAPIIFGSSTNALPDFWDYLPRVPHGIGARLLIGLLVLHAGAAIYHHFVKRDRLLRRMWFAKGE